MQKPSENWKRLRRSALERARRNTIEPLEPLCKVYMGASALFLVGFVRFRFMDQPAEFTWFAGAFVIAVTIAGALLPILLSSMLTLHFADRKLERLISE